MPDTIRRLTTKRLPLVLVLALIPCLLSNSCASTHLPGSGLAARDLTTEAEVAYQFLVYEDLLHQGNKAEAAKILAGLAQGHPSPEVAVELANLQWGQNEREKATETLEKGLRAFPGSRQLTFYLANAYQMRRMSDQAVAVLTHFLEKSPNDAAAIQELASMLVDGGKFKDAAKRLARIPEKDRDATAWFLLSKTASGLGHTKEAIGDLRAALDKDPNLMAAWFELGNLLDKTGDTKGAAQCYEQMQRLGEDTSEVRAKLIRLAIKQKNPARAMKILRDTPADKPLLLDAMSALIEAGYPKQAREAYGLLEAAGPDSPDLPFYKAVLAYEGDKNPKEALKILAKVPADNPNYDKSLSFRIQIAQELGDTATARAILDEARKQFPDKKEFVAMEAGMFDKAGDTAKAATVLGDAAAKWPDDLDILYRYGVVLEKLKRRDEARGVMEKIVAKDPTNPDALNYLGYALADEGRDLDKALTMIRTALEKEPDNPFFLDSLAWALFKLKRSEEALTVMEKVVAHQVKDAIIWEHYGDIAAALGRRDLAQKAYRSALQLGSESPAAVKKKLEAL